MPNITIYLDEEIYGLFVVSPDRKKAREGAIKGLTKVLKAERGRKDEGT